MSLAVWMPRTSGAVFEDALRAALDPAVELTVGPGRAEPAAYAVLVAGRPSPEDLDASSALRLLVIPWAGLPAATREHAAARPRIAVHNLHHNAPATAEMAVGLLLAAARRIVPADRALRAGDWSIRYDTEQGLRLAGRTALVLGYGAIGQRVSRALVALDMRVLAVRRRESPAFERDGVELHGVSALDELLPQVDVVVVCVPATEDTQGLLDARRLAALRRGAVLVNVARGEAVEEEALYAALRSGQLGAAGLDVWYRYPRDEAERTCTLPAGRPFQELDNVVLSPHRAGHGSGTENERARHLAVTLNAAARGAPIPHRVDLERGY